MDEVIHLSPSKVKDHRRCKRYFYGKHVEKWPVPQGAGAALGDDVHQLLEVYLTKGIFPATDVEIEWKQDNKARAVSTANAMLPHLPDPGSVNSRHVEMWARINIGDGRLFRGRIDWLKWVDLRHLQVNDFKTTSNLSYALTEQQLRRDPQVIGYAAFCFIVLGAEKVTVRFMYVCTASPHHTMTVEVVFRAEDVIGGSEDERLWHKLVETDLEDMYETTDLISFADVEPNLNGCGMYGGCAFKTR